jgi:hypothetical protein
VVVAVGLWFLVRSPVWLVGVLPVIAAVAPVVTRVRAAVTRIRQAVDTRTAERLAELDAEEDRLERAITELAPGQEAVHFAKSRHGSQDYRQHLGVVSLLRKDLEVFARILTEESGGLERVVLYVDDLDRCPPDVVVKVLEAVHLLVAMSAFVVVVGVDPRWLHQAIAHHYATMLPGTSMTPAHYLEKIFQIPFRLPPMDERGFTELVRALAGGDLDTVPATVDTVRVPDAIPAGPTMPMPPVASQAAEVQVRPQQLVVTDVELQFLARLAPLVPTPRAAKRLTNLYRLVRARLSAAELDQFVRSGTFRSVLVLLALHAESGAAAFERIDAEPDLAWLIERLGAVELADSAEAFREWMPLVRRFSFG